MNWHILDAKSIWLKEFAASLSTMVPTHGWCPEVRNFGAWNDWEKTDVCHDPPLTTTSFPLQRGYAKFPISWLSRSETRIAHRMIARSGESCSTDVLVCTSPFYAPVAALWPGRVIYYLTDLTKAYAGMNPDQVVALDKKMCRVAEVVCPNSQRIAGYLIDEAGCDPKKITVIPNATRLRSIVAHPLTRPAEVPSALAGLPRPIIGVIGNLAGNLDWLLLRETVERVPDVSWAFIGPTSMEIPDPLHRAARAELLQRGGSVRFTGSKPYGELFQYARSFDAALIPYVNAEPTRSGSATRFYEHLAACRPILATRGHQELLTKEPLLKLVDNTDQLSREINRLRAKNFRDGYEELRWRTSLSETWEMRCRSMLKAANVEELEDAASTAKPIQGLRNQIR